MNVANLQKALEIVGKYVNPQTAWCDADHDIIYFPLRNTAKISPEDEAELHRLGAHVSSEGDCWATFL